MFVKILGAFDLFVALILFILALKVSVAPILIIFLIIVLAAKSLPFILNFCIGSVIDIVAAIILLLSLFFSISSLILIAMVLVVAQKGVFSLF